MSSRRKWDWRRLVRKFVGLFARFEGALPALEYGKENERDENHCVEYSSSVDDVSICFQAGVVNEAIVER
jgi:hypothetical protein